MALKVGDQAPAFTLLNTEAKEVSLADFAGKKVVLHFFPLAFTGVCTTQLCTLRDNCGSRLSPQWPSVSPSLIRCRF